MGKRKTASLSSSSALPRPPSLQEQPGDSTPPNILASPQMRDVWLNVIGPLLNPHDIINLSMVSRCAADIAHNIRTHEGLLVIRKRLGCHRTCKAWPYLKINLQLYKWKQTKNTSTTLLCRPAALHISYSTLNSLDFVDSATLERLELQNVTFSKSEVLDNLLIRSPVLKSFHVDAWSVDIMRSWVIPSLAHLSRLDQFHIRMSCWRPSDLIHFAPALQLLVNLKSLTISYSCHRMDLLVPALCCLTNLTDLNLDSNCIGVQAQHLAQALTTLPNMTCLSLECDWLAEHFVHLVGPVSAMHNLTTLMLGRDDLNDKSVEHLVAILEGKHNLQTLNLADNRISTAGIEVLIPTFQQMTTLSTLGIAQLDRFPQVESDHIRARLRHIANVTV